MSKVIEEFNGQSYYALSRDETRDFMLEYIELCKKHNLVVVPVDSNCSVNFHDTMRIIPLDEDSQNFIKHTGVCLE